MNKIKKLKVIIFILLFQSFMFLYLVPLNNMESFDMFLSQKNILNIIVFLNLGFSIFNIIYIKGFMEVLNKSFLYKIIETKLKKQEEYINKINAQKHDFANHLQTIYTFIEFDKPKKTLEYLDEISEDLNSLKSEESLNQSTLETILLQKQKEAEKKNINFEFDLDNGAEFINLSLNQLFRLIYNLSDNAIEASLDSNNPKVKINGEQINNNYILTVKNNGKVIPEDMIEKIQEPNISTKGDNRGYGVYIIKDIINQANGKLKITSKREKGTVFKCIL